MDYIAQPARKSFSARASLVDERVRLTRGRVLNGNPDEAFTSSKVVVHSFIIHVISTIQNSMILFQSHCFRVTDSKPYIQVLEYRPHEGWAHIGNLQIAIRVHAVLTITATELSCL